MEACVGDKDDGDGNGDDDDDDDDGDGDGASLFMRTISRQKQISYIRCVYVDEDVAIVTMMVMPC